MLDLVQTSAQLFLLRHMNPLLKSIKVFQKYFSCMIHAMKTKIVRVLPHGSLQSGTFSKQSVIRTLPVVFSLQSGDYSQHVKNTSASQMMSDTWTNLGHRFTNSAKKVMSNGGKEKR